MILYNVTVKVEPAIHDEWLTWVKEEHIKDVLATGTFSSARISRLLGQNEVDGKTYSVQYLAPTLEDFQRYQKDFAPIMQKKHAQRFPNQFVAFRTIMELHDEFKNDDE